MSLDFPTSPSIGDRTSIGDKIWQWNGNAWKLIPNLIQGVQGLSNQGVQGVQGIAGSTQGTQGAVGQGIQGTQGLQGTQGTQGVQGIQGLTGIQGAAAASSLSISTTTSTQFQYIPVVSSASTNILGISSLSKPIVFIPSSGNLGIGTTNPTAVVSVSNTSVLAAGIVTAFRFFGDGSQLSGIIATVDGQDFNTGITSALSSTLVGVGSSVLSLPSTAGREYIIYSINASNIAVGNTEVNVIGAFDINSTGERSYFAYNIPIPTGTAVELLKQPQILNPSDVIMMRSTDYTRSGIDTAVQVHITYEEKVSTAYFGIGFGIVSIATSNPTTIYTANTASIIQSIRLANRTDSGAYPVSVSIVSGVNTTYLVDNLIVPKYSSIEILDTPKRMNVNDIMQVQTDQFGTIDVQVSGKTV